MPGLFQGFGNMQLGLVINRFVVSFTFTMHIFGMENMTLFSVSSQSQIILALTGIG